MSHIFVHYKGFNYTVLYISASSTGISTISTKLHFEICSSYFHCCHGLESKTFPKCVTESKILYSMWLKSDRNENEVKPTTNNVDIPKNLVSRDNSKKRVVSMFWLFCVDLYSTNSFQGANSKKGKHKKWYSMKYKKNSSTACVRFLWEKCSFMWGGICKFNQWYVKTQLSEWLNGRGNWVNFVISNNVSIIFF